VEDGEPYRCFRRGYDLYRRGGHMAQAEAAYREAIAGGFTDAWLYLGVLLDTQPGRGHDEEAALRAAMASDRVETAAWAAANLGVLLDLRYDDRSAARACYEFAEKHGPRAIAFEATVRLSEILAYEGDLEGARDRARSFAIWFGDERNVDTAGGSAEISSWVRSRRAGSRYSRELFRRYRRFRYRVGRRRRALVARSEWLTSRSNEVKGARKHLAGRFWAEDDD
jgi:hypothetical protein